MSGTLRSAGLCLLSGLLFFLGIHWWWPLVFVSLSPLAICFCVARGWRGTLVAAAVSGTLMWYAIQFPLWTYNHQGIFLLGCYQSISIVLMAVGVRAVWRRWRWRLVWVWPVAVVGGEYLRMLGVFGVPFGSLAGACRDQRWMLQVCDLGGIYTLSFPIAMVQGLLADHFLRRYYPPVPGRRRFAPLATVVVVWVGVAVYGAARLTQVESGMRRGPRVAVIQPDVVYVLNSVQSYDPGLLLTKMKELSEQAAGAGEPPDLFLWPEGIASFPLRNREFFQTPHEDRMGTDPGAWDALQRESARFEAAFATWAGQLGAPLVVGMEVLLPADAGEAAPFRAFNAAQIYRPGSGQSRERQFKMRLYPGGEYFPWAGTWIDRTLGGWGFFPSVFGVPNKFQPGETRERFRLSDDAGSPRFAMAICSEILTPAGSGIFLRPEDGRKPFDFLVNIANEGTFLRNTAQVHQFGYLPFRAVEARVGIARSSNAGLTGFVSPTGGVYGLVANEDGESPTGLGAPELPLIHDLMAFRRANESAFRTDANKRAELNCRIEAIQSVRKEAGIEGYRVEPVYTYPGMTLYQRLGDWLGLSMLVALLAMGACARPCGVARDGPIPNDR